MIVLNLIQYKRIFEINEIKMATSFKKTTIKSYPRVGEKVTTDTLYWKNYEV